MRTRESTEAERSPVGAGGLVGLCLGVLLALLVKGEDLLLPVDFGWSVSLLTGVVEERRAGLGDVDE
jgi:hypothetical protein